MAIIRNPIIGGAHALTVDQLAALADAFTWHGMAGRKLTEEAGEGLTYRHCYAYRDAALAAAGLPPMDVLQMAADARKAAK